MKFDNLCCRCGFCCLSESCKVAQSYFNIQKKDCCPALSFDGLKANCKLFNGSDESRKLMGIGAGCCIKARVYKNGICYDFASLSEQVKRHIVSIILNRK